ncbi:MAG TPA: glycoside hydrolase family 18 protein, partial [Deinococcales bacterium]|nr:glycoside hydrolase family 18 protein [Deinococcales bacterium]
IALAGALCLSAPALARLGTPSPALVGYVTNWSIYSGFDPATIPADKLTHINYAFAKINEDGTCAMTDPWADVQKPFPGDTENLPFKGLFHQMQLLKEKNPKLKVLMSVGGWSLSKYFSNVAATAAARDKFAASCVKTFITDYPGVFDGLDIDWEYPVGGGDGGNIVRPTDRSNATMLFAELRRQLFEAGLRDGKQYLLTAALPAATRGNTSYDLEKVAPMLDLVNVMTYDLNGTWGAITNHNSPLYANPADPTPAADRAVLNIDGTVKLYEAAGVPAAKIVIGAPFYGHAFVKADPAGGGLFQKFAGGPDPTPAYKQIATMLPTATAGWDDAAKVPYLLDASNTFITYDDPRSLAEKAGYVKANGLGGVMFWEISQDDAAHSLVNALWGALK